MPSGPKKRLRAKRKKQGSPAIDANSDRETEALSVTGSVDVDDLESGLDTPVQVSSRPACLDREAVTSQTDEWVRVSDFDVGTPTSQTGENDPATEDGEIGSSRRSLDKLAEWETVSGDHIPGRLEGSIHSLEEEPSECEAASTHSSESYTNLPSPNLAEREKGDDSFDSDRKNSLRNRSICISSFSSSTAEKNASAAAETFDLSGSVDMRDEVSSPHHLPLLPAAGEGQVEEIGRLILNFVEKEILHGAVPVTTFNVLSDERKVIVDDTTAPTEGTIIRAPDIDDQSKIVKTFGTYDPVLMEANLVEESHEVREEVPTTSTESALAATKPAEQEIISANSKDIGEVFPLPSMPVPAEESPNEEKKVLLIADETLIKGIFSGDEKLFRSSLKELVGEEDEVVMSLVDVVDKEVNTDERIASPIVDVSAVADDKEVASTSMDAQEEKTMGDAPASEVSNFVEKNLRESQEFTANPCSGKAPPMSGTSEPMVLGEGRHRSLSTPMEKNGTEKRGIEAKSLTGCCGVLYWLLGWDR